MRRTQIFLVGFYGMDNVGDDAIRESIERAGDELDVEIAHYAVRGGRLEDPRSVRFRGPGCRAYLNAVRSADRVVLGGGGLFKDQGRRWRRYGILLELLGTAGYARLLGKSVALVGMGVGPIYTELGARLIALTARLASCRMVRDQASADVLERLGIRDAEVRADPVFSMRAAMISGAVRAEHRQWPPHRMLISARGWYLQVEDGAERWRGLVTAIAKMADEAIEDGLAIEFACLHWPQDRVAAQEIVSAMRYGGQTKIPATATHWWGLADAVRCSDVLIAMRYHAVVCATLVGTPVFALSYEPKVMSLAEEIGIPMVDVNDRTQVDCVAEEVRTFRGASVPTPSSAIVDAATERLSVSAWQGLRSALTGANS